MTETKTQPKERVVRVFISSTFRDMNAERDELGKFIFPELRRFCRQREVEFVEVDLRWGVTEEQSQRGETLAVCLAEIERCRPYFIGLLGERYGWVPGDFRPDVVEGNPWLADLKDRSVTELEILHGVLNNPAMSGRSHFYFRDPRYLDQIPAEQRPDFTSEGEQAGQKLAGLKERIRQSGLPLLENYPDPHSVAQQIGADLHQAIEAEFPVTETRDRLAEEAAGHEAFAQSRSRVYVGRSADLNHIDVFVSGAPVQARPATIQIPVSVNPVALPQKSPSDKPTGLFGSLKNLFSHPDRNSVSSKGGPVEVVSAPSTGVAASAIQRGVVGGGRGEGGLLAILGPSGSGKSALLANWALRYRPAHPDEYIFLHFLGSTPASAGYDDLLRRLLGELKARFGIAEDLPGTPDELRKALPNWLAMAAARCPCIVLVLDGLNQLEDRDQAPDLVWLPEQFPDNVRVLVSTLPGRSLDALRQRPHTELEVQPLSEGERLQLVQAYLGHYERRLEERRARRIVSAEPAANPLYLRVLLEELRQFGSYEKLDERIDYYLEAKTIPDLYKKVLARLESDYERQRPGLVKEALSLVWAARRGLSESELLELLGGVPRAVWSPLYLALEEALVERGGVINFFHDFLRQAVQARYLPDAGKQREVRLRLADYFEQRSLDSRQVDELPWLLAQAEEWQRLYDRLADLDFFTASWKNDPYEVKSYWAQVESRSSLRKVDAYRPVLEAPKMYQKSLGEIASLLEDTGSPHQALGLYFYLVEHYQQAGDLVGFQSAAVNSANILYALGKVEQALALYKGAERICRQLGIKDGLSVSLGNQGLIMKDRGDLEGALLLHKEEEILCRQMGNQDGLQASLGNQALILQSQGDLDKAMMLHKEQERLCRQLGDQYGLSISLGNQAAVLIARNDQDGAMALLKEQERLCRLLGKLDGLQRALGNQALILKVRLDLDGAMTLFKEQEHICRQFNNLKDLQTSLSNQADILYSCDDLDGALVLYKEKESLCRQMGNLDGLQASLSSQGSIMYTQGDLERALALFKDQESICREGGNLNGMAGAIGNQANVLYARGDLDGSLVLHKEEERICRQVGNLNRLSISLGNQALILKDRGAWEGALDLYKEQESIFRQMGNLRELAISLAGQAIIVNEQNKPMLAVQILRQAHSLARQSGYSALVREIENLIASIEE